VKKITTKKFIERANAVHGDRYDYSKAIYISSKDHVKIICPEHGVFEKAPNKHLSQKQGCPKCSSKKLTDSDFIKAAKGIHNNKYDYKLVKYKSNSTKVKIICPHHGVFEKTYINHITNKQGCPHCSNEELSERYTISQNVILKRFSDVYGDRYDYSKVYYTGMHEKVTIISKEYGEFEQTPFNHLRGYGYSKESIKVRDLDTFIKKSKDIFGDNFIYDNFIYTGIFNKSYLTCKKHDHRFLTSANTHLYAKHGGCSKCLEDEKRISFSDFIKSCEETHKNFYDYSLVKEDVYDGITRTKIDIVCPNHGVFNQSIFDHYTMGNGCPKCGNKKSRLEDYIESILIRYNVNYTQHKLGLISPFELDFYLPDYNIAIEVNGLRYHTEHIGKKGRQYHLNKSKMCENIGIKLIHIFEDEIVHKPKIVLNRLRSILNKKTNKLYARKCEVRVIESGVKSSFLEKYHLQGDDNSSIHLGLFYKNKLVSVMTFGHVYGESNCLMNTKGGYDLKRFCGIFNFYVIGGASKLLKFFERNYTPNTIISYADKKWSDGDLYFKMGFGHIRTNPPNYRVTTGKCPYKSYHKKLFQRSRLEKKLDNYDETLSEWENLKNNKYDRIWDCGLMVFEKKLDNFTSSL